MKKTILMVVAAMMVTLNVNAQNEEPKNEIGVYYGFASASTYVSLLAGSFSAASSIGGQGGFWGPIGIEYYHHISPVVSVGAVASIAGCKWGDTDYFKSQYITVMPSVKFNWLRKEIWGLYSGVSAGIMFVNDKVSPDYKEGKVKGGNASSFMFQATALGAEVGGKVRGFLELGFGEKGFLCAGVRYKF